MKRRGEIIMDKINELRNYYSFTKYNNVKERDKLSYPNHNQDVINNEFEGDFYKTIKKYQSKAKDFLKHFEISTSYNNVEMVTLFDYHGSQTMINKAIGYDSISLIQSVDVKTLDISRFPKQQTNLNPEDIKELEELSEDERELFIKSKSHYWYKDTGIAIHIGKHFNRYNIKIDISSKFLNEYGLINTPEKLLIVKNKIEELLLYLTNIRININDFKVVRLDISKDVKDFNHDTIFSYLKRFEKRYQRKNTDNDTIYFHNKSRTLYFYNKTKELREVEHKKIADQVTRIEYSLRKNKNISKYLNIEQMQFKHLFDMNYTFSFLQEELNQLYITNEIYLFDDVEFMEDIEKDLIYQSLKAKIKQYGSLDEYMNKFNYSKQKKYRYKTKYKKILKEAGSETNSKELMRNFLYYL
jgi:hypothetical protein